MSGFWVRALVAAVLLASLPVAVSAQQPSLPPPPELTEQAIEAADLDGWRARLERAKAAESRRPKSKRKAEAAPPAGKAPPDPFLVRVQILLDRAHASPGVIDGRDGRNFRKAVRAFQEMRKLPVTGEPDAEFWAALSADQRKATLVYELTQADVDGPYSPPLPKDFARLAKMKRLGFVGPEEMLAERFHLDEPLLRALNPAADFRKAGQKILAPDVAGEPIARVARIVVERGGGELKAYDKDGALVLVDPATVGSEDTPSPSGRMKVTRAYPDPPYHYDPKKNFQQGRNRRKLTLPPGPNGPVGSMWIDLTKPTYGIHGTPDPEKIDKTGSHGCVRLTNWDAQALAALVEPGKTEVEFR
jgi:lipoprotein-anchoring transpeptidase ErfK/SrfK